MKRTISELEERSFPTYLELIGNTPMVRIENMLPLAARHARVLLKLEMQNPGGSIKDRIALAMIEAAEKEGNLTKGKTVVEATSGNTGIGIAMICAAKGYKCIIIMQRRPQLLERYLICRQFGADIHLTAPGRMGKGVMEYYHKLLKDNPDYVGMSQFDNKANPATHIQNTGPEIWTQTGGKIDYFIHGIGTGGTISGAGSFLKSMNPQVKVVAVEPSNARVHVGGDFHRHLILGLAPGFMSNFIAKDLPPSGPTDKPWGVVDEWQHANTDEAIYWAKRAALLEGIMVGPSAGASLKVAVDIASRPESKGKTLVVIQASHAIRYTEHPLWADVKNEAERALPPEPDMSPTIELCQWRSSRDRPTSEPKLSLLDDVATLMKSPCVDDSTPCLSEKGVHNAAAPQVGVHLYCNPLEPCCWKAQLALALKGISFELHQIQQGEQYNPAYVRMNQACTLPVLVIDGRVTTGASNIISVINSPVHGNDLLCNSSIATHCSIADSIFIEALTFGIFEDPDPRAPALKKDPELHFREKIKTLEQLRQDCSGDSYLVDAYRNQIDLAKKCERTVKSQALVTKLLDWARHAIDQLDAQLERGPFSDAGWLCADHYTAADIYWTSALLGLTTIGLGPTLFHQKKTVVSYFLKLLESKSYVDGVKPFLTVQIVEDLNRLKQLVDTVASPCR